MKTLVKVAAAAGAGALAALAGFWWLLSTGQDGAERFLAEFNDDPDRPTVTAIPVPALRGGDVTVPVTHGMQLLTGDDLDEVIAHLVACGAANALATAEPGGWASTSARLGELAETVADARVDAALKWLDDRHIELVRRHR